MNLDKKSFYKNNRVKSENVKSECKKNGILALFELDMILFASDQNRIVILKPIFLFFTETRL
jgi:hypothetical protein